MVIPMYHITLTYVCATRETCAAVRGMGIEGNRSLLRLHQGFVRPDARIFTPPE